MESLTPEEVRRWPVAEEIYRQHGSPTREQPDQLAAATKEISERCYIAIIYRRCKELERKEWPAKPVPAAPITRPAKSEEELIAYKRATLTPEDFENWMRLHQQGRRITAESDKSVIPIEKGRKAYG